MLFARSDVAEKHQICDLPCGFPEENGCLFLDCQIGKGFGFADFASLLGSDDNPLVSLDTCDIVELEELSRTPWKGSAKMVPWKNKPKEYPNCPREP